MTMNRGDVVLVDYPFTTGGTKVRPALVVQSAGIVRVTLSTGLSKAVNEALARWRLP
jgi:mRNA-degrading endonuclease toxin of MazEF toxin-antitoxin module